jgi:hypothetical protein
MDEDSSSLRSLGMTSFVNFDRKGEIFRTDLTDEQSFLFTLTGVGFESIFELYRRA